MASTISSALTSALTAIGSTIPAAVKPATVAEPTLTLITVAISQARINGDILEPLSPSAI